MGLDFVLFLTVLRMEYEIDYTNFDVSPWGGLALMRQTLAHCGFRAALESCMGLPRPGSNSGHDVAELVESFIVSVWCGPTGSSTPRLPGRMRPCARFSVGRVWQVVMPTSGCLASLAKRPISGWATICSVGTSGSCVSTTLPWTWIRASSRVMACRRVRKRDTTPLSAAAVRTIP